MEKQKNKIKLISKWRLIRFIMISIFSLIILAVLIIYIYINTILFGGLEVDYFDVGQGDSELIKTPGHKLILIDGGPDNIVVRRLGETLPFYQKNIDLVILSHFHDDHIAGLLEIFKRYQVETFIYLNNYQSTYLTELLKIAELKGTKTISLESSVDIFPEPACMLKLLNPNILNIKTDQNNSIVSRLDCRNKSFIFSGDNSSLVEKALLNSGFNLKAMVLKASHHGSNSANSEIYLQKVGARDFVVSDGINNKFKHPNPEIIERAKMLNLKIFRTDKQGTIRIFSEF